MFKKTYRKFKRIASTNKYRNLFRSNIAIEEPATIPVSVKLNSNIQIGRHSWFNANTVVYGETKIGRFVTTGRNCEIGVVNHPIERISASSIFYNKNYHVLPEQYKSFSQIEFKNQIHGCKIGNDVWIGTMSIIKAGVIIGDGAVVAAHCMVTKDVPPYAIVGGIPAKIIRYRFDKNIISRLLKIKWWEYDLMELDGIEFDNIEKALVQLEERFCNEKKSK